MLVAGKTDYCLIMLQQGMLKVLIVAIIMIIIIITIIFNTNKYKYKYEYKYKLFSRCTSTLELENRRSRHLVVSDSTTCTGTLSSS